MLTPTIQQVLMISTGRRDLRAEAEGWTCEDPRLLREGPIGKTPGVRFWYSYPTVFHALADGWRLLAPPADETWINADGVKIPSFGWWLVREVPR